ncbi:MAG: RNA polymerase sigma factor [Planctomycetes bacterium]|nr:RNA polymerase sigma factor [Planctomycetota bacterium]
MALAQPADPIMELSIQRLIAGDGQEFDRFVRQHQTRVTNLVSRLLGWSQDAPDVVQDVFVDVLKAFASFRQESSVETWLTRITINACRRHQRRAAMRRLIPKVLRYRRGSDFQVCEEPGALEDGDLAHVREAIHDLPPHEREVIVLRYLEQVSVSDTATLLGISRNNAEVRLHRARERLRQALGDWFQ